MSYDLTKLARLSDVRALGVRVKELQSSNGGEAFSVSLETSSWLEPTGGEPEPVSSYTYRCFIPATSLDVTLTTKDRIDVIFDNDTISAIKSNGDDICPYTVTTADGVYIFTNTMPTTTYTAQLWLMNGVTDGTVTSQSKTVDPTTTAQVVTADAGVDYLSSVTVNAISYEEESNSSGGTTVTIAGS